jgi:D-xylulose reductase
VFGAGPVGLLTLAAAKALGARRIVSVDVAKERLEFANSFAATDVWSPSKKGEGESNADYSKREAEDMRRTLGIAERGREGIDVVFDATGVEVFGFLWSFLIIVFLAYEFSGNQVCIQTGIFLAKMGGKFVQVGGPTGYTIHSRLMCRCRLDWHGPRYRDDPDHYCFDKVSAARIYIRGRYTDCFLLVLVLAQGT